MDKAEYDKIKKEYEREQAKLQRYEKAVMEQARKEIRTRLNRMAQEALNTGAVDHEALTADIDSIYQFYKDMAADRATALAEGFVKSTIECFDLKPIKKPDYMKTIHTTGTGWTGEWYKLPDGRTVYVTETRKLDFLRKYHLSMDTSPMKVWAVHNETAAEAEERVFTVIEGGKKLGRSAKEIGKDLEELVNYDNGGERVIGRWGRMVSPYNADGTRNPQKIQEGWERAWVAKQNEQLMGAGKGYGDPGWIEYHPTHPIEYRLNEETGAVEPVKIKPIQESKPEARQWIDQESAGKQGRVKLPPGAKEYTRTFGKAGLDYRAIRITRTESAVRFNERQREIAEDTRFSTGKVTRRLSEQRDSWKCDCVKAYQWINEGGGKKPVEIPPQFQAPLHPSCFCTDHPVMKDAETVRKERLDKYFGDVIGG